MNFAWMCPVLLEKAVAKEGSMSGMFTVTGDSMIWVNKHGYRTVNEKLQYNELAYSFLQWNGRLAEYTNLVQIAVWDKRAQDHSASGDYGSATALSLMLAAFLALFSLAYLRATRSWSTR